MDKIKIQIKNKLNGSILFEYEKENNTIQDTLTEGVKNGVDLSGADLSGAYLSGANLSCLNLRCADLSGAYLCGVDLSGADLCGVDLSGANLSCVNLRCAVLSGANLCGAYLCGVDLSGAVLIGANLRNVDLRGANRCGANLRHAKSVPYIPFACPSDGAFIGWKKVNYKLVKLEIPEDATRCSATTRKCRCDKAKVLAITDLDGKNPIDEILNTSQQVSLLYKVGKMVYPDSFDEDRWNECSHGIHFFINKQDAINY